MVRPNPSGMFPSEKRRLGYRHTQRDNHMKTQGEDDLSTLSLRQCMSWSKNQGEKPQEKLTLPTP